MVRDFTFTSPSTFKNDVLQKLCTVCSISAHKVYKCDGMRLEGIISSVTVTVVRKFLQAEQTIAGFKSLFSKDTKIT